MRKALLCLLFDQTLDCLERTNRLVKTCEFTGRAFVSSQGAQQVPGLPNFLLVLVASATVMRFSPTENRTRGCVSKQRGRKFGFARDDKGEGGASMGNWLVAERVVR